MKNEFERELIIKMAKLCEEYVEPYDSMDRSPEVRENYTREVKYNVYKELFLEMQGR